MPLGAGSNWPVAVDADSTLGPTSGIVAGVTHLGDTGTNQGDLLGIVKNLINGEIKIENAAQCGNMWSTVNGSYTQPAIGATVTVTTLATPYAINTWCQPGMIVDVQPGITGGNIGGYYLVTSVASSTSVVLLNLSMGNTSTNYGTAAANTVPTASIVSFAGWFNGPSCTDAAQTMDKEWEFLGNNSTITSSGGLSVDTEWTGTLAGTAEQVSTDTTAGDSTGSNAYGLLNITAGTATTGSVVLGGPRIFIPSLTALEMSANIIIQTLSTGTNTYSVGFGVCTSSTALANPFMGVVYQQASSTAWNVATGATATAATLTTTGVTVNINTNYNLRFTLNNGWTSLSAWVNHANLTTVTSGLQTGQVFPIVFINATAGTLSTRSFLLDRIKLRVYTGR